MIVLFFQNQFCTRALKQATALNTIVDRIIGVTSKQPPVRKMHKNSVKGIFNKIYSNIDNIEKFKEIILLENPDIVHCHNFPDTQAKIALESRGISKYRVVHDIHDHGTYQYQNLSLDQQAEEDYVEKYADGIVYVSDLSRDYIIKERNVNSANVVIHSKPNLRFFPNIKENKTSRNFKLVYQGGIHSTLGHHRNYMNIFSEITAQNIELHVYTSTIYRIMNKNQQKIYGIFFPIVILLSHIKIVVRFKIHTVFDAYPTYMGRAEM